MTSTTPSGGLVSRLRGAIDVLYREAIKFGVIGAVAFVIEMGSFNLLRRTLLEEKPTAAVIVSASLATVFAWLGNRIWTFDSFDLASPYVQLNSGVQGDEGNFPGQYSVGTFTADYKTQFVYISSGFGSQYNIVMVRRLDGEPVPVEPLRVVSAGFNASAFEITVANFNIAKSYQLVRSPDLLSPFLPIGDPFNPVTPIQTVTDATPLAGRGFYRIVEAP